MNRRILTATFIAAVALAAPAAHAGSKGGTSRACLTSSARALLGRIEARFGKMQIVSTCRRGARIAGTGRISRHASGNAIDFKAGSRKGAVVSWLTANHKSGGTMTYRGMSHIHVDVGQHFVSLNSGGRGGYRSSKRRYAAASTRGRRLAGTRYGLTRSAQRSSSGGSSGGRFIPSSSSDIMKSVAP